MSLTSTWRSIERFVSFGGICGVVGVVCDLLEPVGSYTLWALIAGAVILVAGLIMASFRGWSDQVAYSASAFGALLVIISIGFITMAPDGDRGVLATEIPWVADAQSELLGIKEVALKIAEDTAVIADNTIQIAGTSAQIADTNSQIALTSTKIATDAEMVRHLSFSMEGLLSALESQDRINIRAYCDRGYRIYQTGYLFRPERGARNLSDGNYEQLAELKCFDQEQICDSSGWYGLENSLDPRRVAEQCGTSGIKALAQLEIDRKQSEADALRRREECEVKARKDPMYASWPQIMTANC